MDGKFQGLLAANVTLAGIQRFFDSVKPMLGTILIVVQILVGLATAYYFFRKAKAVRPNKKDQ